MNRIDKLILEAKAAVFPGLGLSTALIERNGDSWAAVVHLSDGVQGHAPTIKRATWATLGAAMDHIKAMAAEHPNSRDVTIIVDDLG